MALTAAEEAELAALEAEFGSAPATPTSGLTPAEEAELAALEAEFGQAPVTSGLTPAEEAELAALEAEFGSTPVVDGPMKGYTDRELRIIAETGIDKPMPEPVNRGPRAIGINPAAPERDVMGELSTAFQNGLKETDAEAAARRSKEARAKADATAEIARRATEAAQPGRLGDALMSGAGGIIDGAVGLSNIVIGAPGSISNAMNAPDLDEWMAERYARGSYDNYTEADKIALYNEEAQRSGAPLYEDQLSNLPTIGGRNQEWADNKAAILANPNEPGWKKAIAGVSDYEPEYLTGELAQTTGMVVGSGGVGGGVPRLAGVALGIEAGDQATKGSDDPWLKGGAQVLGGIAGGGIAGGLNAAIRGADDAALSGASYQAISNQRKAALDAITRTQGYRAVFESVQVGNAGKIQALMSAARVMSGAGRDQGIVGTAVSTVRDVIQQTKQGNIAPLAELATKVGAGWSTGGASTIIPAVYGAAARASSKALANPVVQQTGRAALSPRSTGVAIVSQGGQVVEEPSDIVPLTAQ